MTIHAIIGRGGNEVPATVIQDGLRDLLKKGDTIVMPWYGKPSKELEAVYDYVLDNEMDYHLIYDEKTPPSAFDNTFKAPKDLHAYIGQMLDHDGAKVAILFPEDADIEDDICTLMNATGGEPELLDLGNGLVPLEVTDEAEEPEEEATAEDGYETFTREELEGLSFKMLKRAAAGKSDVVPKDSEEAIRIILGEDSDDGTLPGVRMMEEAVADMEARMEARKTDPTELLRDLAAAINRNSFDALLGVPDYVLAEYALECMRSLGDALAATREHSA